MISDAQIKQYNEEGYTIVENVFSMDDLNPILNEFEEIVDDFLKFISEFLIFIPFFKVLALIKFIGGLPMKLATNKV